ncbi:hypothetical protein LguiB_017150 [Lonicera macranthoides]
MGIILLLLLALSTFFLFLLSRVRKNVGSTLLPPGPRGLPFIGNFHQLDNSFLQNQLWKLSEEYGPLMSLRLGCLPTLVVSSAKMAKEVLKTQDLIFCSRLASLGQQKLSYNGLDLALSPYNDYWKEMKKIVTLHLFSSKRVQYFRPIREDEVCRMIKKVSELAASSKIANLSELILSLTSIIICRVAFSKRFDEGYEGSRFHRFVTECQAVMVSFYFSDHFPLMGWLDRLRGLRSRLDKIFQEMDLFFQELIDEHLDPERKSSAREDIIDIFLQLKRDQSSSIALTFNHIKAMLLVKLFFPSNTRAFCSVSSNHILNVLLFLYYLQDILLGGTETSASTVIFAMTELMKNPTVMEKAQEEVRKIIGKKGSVDEDDLKNLPFLKMVVKEALRLHPPVPLLIPRVAMQKCVINGFEIQQKTRVYVNAYAVGRDPECWKDPLKFFPERFLDTTIDYKGQDFELIPFGAGRRSCPGIFMGSTTVELILSNLLYFFDWELPPGMKNEDIDTIPMPGITVQKKIPLCLVAKKI